MPFADHQFDLALCSDNSSVALIDELCRVATEVRVFPLLDEQGKLAETLGLAMVDLQQKNFGLEIRQVSYHQLKGSNAMLRIWAKECSVV